MNVSEESPVSFSELPLFPHQREAAQLLAQERGGIAWWKMGQGKTRVGLAAFLMFPGARNVTSHCLVICRPESFSDWQRDAATMGCLDRVRLMSYGQLSTQSGDATVRDIMADPRIVFVIADELYLYKNHATLRSRRLQSISELKPTVGLSGTIMSAQHMDDVYGQAMAVNKHRRIARSMTSFREEFMLGINDFGGVRWAPKRGAYARLMNDCSSFANVYMPKKSDRAIHESHINVDVTSHQQELFRQLQDTLSLPEFGMELSSAASLIVKVQQIANGWVKGHAEPDQGSGIVPVASNKPRVLFAKLDELLAEGERVLVWCAFRYDVLTLLAMAQDRHIKAAYLIGGEPFNQDRWKRSQVCFATMGSGASVNYFGQVSYAIYFSCSQKPLDLAQSMGRTDRVDSQHTDCYYYHLHVKESMDANVLRRVRQALSAEKGLAALGHDMRLWLDGRSEKETGDVTSQSEPNG